MLFLCRLKMLTYPGVGVADITKLKANGYYTVAVDGHLRKRVVKISTGSKQRDAILGG